MLIARNVTGRNRTDPRARIVQAVLLSVTIAITTKIQAALLGLLIAPAFCIALGVKIRDVLPGLVAANLFIAFLWLTIPFSIPGPALFNFGFWSASRPGVHLALLITLKANAIMVLFLALVCPLALSEITGALKALRIPDKLLHLLAFTFRFIFVLEEERHKLLRAAKNRGFRPGTNLHTYKTYAYIIGMVLIRSWERAEKVQKAMLCRGFSGRYPCIREYFFTKTDLVFSLGTLLAALGIILLELKGSLICPPSW
jgi:cobalt/nickel transport system permease protein